MLISLAWRLRCSHRSLSTSACYNRNRRSQRGIYRPLVLPEHREHGSIQRTVSEEVVRAGPILKQVTEAGAKRRNQARHGEQSENTISLLEELFPQETRVRTNRSAPEKAPREIPWSPMNIGFAPRDNGLEVHEPAAFEPVAQDRRGTGWRYQHATALVLRKAGKNLDIEDFKRALPTGQYLEGWTTRGEGMRGEPGLRIY